MDVEDLRALTRPVEITTLWASREFRFFRKALCGGRQFDLVPDHPESGLWAALLYSGPGDDDTVIGEHVPAFLPTRWNVRHLHSEMRRAAPILSRIVASGDFRWPRGVPDLFQDLVRSPVPVTRELRHARYQAGLWSVLADDWGIELPPFEQLGSQDVIPHRRDGLPCAAAMERAVDPLLAAAFGPVEREDRTAR